VTSAPGEPLEWVSPEQAEFYREVYRFTRTLPDDALDRDATSTFARDTFKRCGDFGILGLPASIEYGGGGAGAVTTMLALEALGYGCSDAGLVFSINAHMWTSVVPLSEFGSPDQKGTWLGRLCAGDAVGCHAITEPEAGSDAFGMTAKARAVDGGYAISGRKAFITNAPVADLLIVFARTSDGLGPFGITAFLVEAGTDGCSVTPNMKKMGLRSSPMAELVLDDCVVPSSSILGEKGRGADVFQASMRWERACIMASQVGVMRRALDASVAYARERRQFGKPIAKFESVSDKIADMKIAIDASRALVLRVGWLMDQGLDTTTEAAVAKAFISEANVRVQLNAIQIHGGYGYMTEMGIERGLRDAVAGTIYSGTSEIQRRIIARGLGL
jgi:hypothetical protein